MHHSTLFDILRSFTPEEIKKFNDFIKSPYFNKKNTVINFYKHIKKFAPKFQSFRLSKEKVWNVLYPGKEFNYGVFKNLIFDLTHLAENFITNEYLQSDKIHNSIEQDYNFLNSLKKRGIKNLFKSKFLLVNKHLDEMYFNKDYFVEKYFYQKQNLSLLKFKYSSHFERNCIMSEELTDHNKIKTALILYYMFQNAINYIYLTSASICECKENPLIKFLKKTDEKHLLIEIIESLKQSSTEIYITINTFYKYYRSVSDMHSIEKYFDFKETLTSNVKYFSKNDLYILYSGLRTSGVNLSSSEFNKSKEYLKIVKDAMKRSIMLNEDGLITETEFAYCIQAACDLGDSIFIKSFTDRYLKNLPCLDKINMQKYSLAHYYFTENKFEKSLELINTIKYDITNMKFYLRELQMMNYFELRDENSFQFFLDSYKHFIFKSRYITEEKRKEQASFICFVNQLFKTKITSDKCKLKNLKLEIASSTVTKKQWLFRKVDELMSV